MKYYIGVDGGGTKTAVSIASADSSHLMSEVTGSAAWREFGVDNVIKRIKTVIDDFQLSESGEIAAIAMGLPCYGESEAGDCELLRAFTNIFYGVPLYLTNDAEVGWAGSLSLSPGVSVVAGTGSIAYGKDDFGNTTRCGGWSEFFSDEGSCYWIGRKVLQLFSRQADGRTPKDELYSIVRKEFNINNDFEIIDLVHTEYISNREKVASLQLIAKEAALVGSCSARNLYIDAAGRLCDMVIAIRDQLQFKKQPFPVSYSGGLFKAGDLILPYFNENITAIGGVPVTPKYEPVHGAVLLAFEQNCPEGLPGLLKRLDEL